jgi:hypothetical protein
MSLLHIPRYHPCQLVKVAMVYIYLDEPMDRVLARIEAIHPDPHDIQAPTYTVTLLTGAHAGETHELPEMALSRLGGDTAG